MCSFTSQGNLVSSYGIIEFLFETETSTEPSTSPRRVVTTRPSDTVMVVSWIPLSYSEARGFISHYTVVYFPPNMSKKQALDTMTQSVPGMDTNTTRIEGLDANTDYIVQVSATNGAGTSHLNPPLLLVANDIGGSCDLILWTISFMNKI